MEGKMTRFGSIEMALNFVADFAHIYPLALAKEKFTEIELVPEITKKIRHQLQKPVGFKFNCPDGKEHVILIDIYKDGFACWYVNGKGFARAL